MSTDLEEFRKMLLVRKNHLDDELEIQAEVMDRINRQVVLYNTRLLELKDGLVRLEARIGDDIKDEDPKLSNPVVDGKVKRNRERIEAWGRYQEARASLEDWQGLHESWKQKGFSIKTLADLYSASYFTLNSTSTSSRQRDRDLGYDTRRSEMRKANEAKEETPTSRTRRRVIT